MNQEASQELPRHELSRAIPGQGTPSPTDVKPSPMENAEKMINIVGPIAVAPQERRRTIVAIVSASIISLVVWGLIVALKNQ